MSAFTDYVGRTGFNVNECLDAFLRRLALRAAGWLDYVEPAVAACEVVVE